ncbi:hypothetical protein PPL_00059 [Heterostelium album PN500]|uniref:Uncharacterized protein n=1 Tax=Heterostelium pallidum (strain ATCC 26659 / Pp 5 / PN500) TaxID=670386 RepID=D3BVQ8_HETP5|nr:hypothetical protein PPL_00059 [Heterostelium album PN500]EFA74561.1 hypothetical protein PPL_00059 [Heterostelium album PN500]|eukprot:XP_020426695.1 hypothetical protein PPL_00059 [Heterostelium album PN500]
MLRCLQTDTLVAVLEQVSINATSELSDSLTIKLINITNGLNSLVGNETQGNDLNVTNLSNGTYQFIVTESSGCIRTTDPFNIGTIEKPTSTPTPTPVNQSYQLLPPSLIYSFIPFLMPENEGIVREIYKNKKYLRIWKLARILANHKHYKYHTFVN